MLGFGFSALTMNLLRMLFLAVIEDIAVGA